jgi:NAD(P)-dependent dehydrogenase (short-subunit alcohol dehydrogenase family)
MDARLDGKVAIVTGGGTGIGAAIAARLAAEGASVAISGRRANLLDEVAGAISSDGGTALAAPGDCATEEGVDALFAKVAAELGPLDVLVNNAAIAGPVAPIWEQAFDGWEDTLRINLSGPWLCSRAAAKVMMDRKVGNIINIGSMSGKRPLAKRTPYTATKLGLVGLTRTLAVELGAFDINVNCISPGATSGPRLQELANKAGITLEQLLEGAAAGSALKRVSEPEDIAGLAAFLASSDARNITGMDITVDGGTWFS